MSDFLYLVDGRQYGPVSPGGLEELISQGRVSRDALVWREGMAEWQPYSTVMGVGVAVAEAVSATQAPAEGAQLRVSGAASQGAVVEEVVCSVCRHSYPQEMTIRHGSAVVCSVCKDQFFANQAARSRAGGGFEYAARWKRLVARILDIALLAVVAIVLMMIGMTFGRMAESPDIVAITYLAVVFVLLPLGSIFYFAYLTGSTGQTIGKRVMGIRVVRGDGGEVSHGRAAWRAVVDFFSGLLLVPGLVSILTLLFTPRRQAVHDMLAGTVVVNG